jgi:hydrogenase maturation factor HypF (carbamoyltransferase family)
VPSSQQFICKKCRSLVTIDTYEHTNDGIPFCRCSDCGARNALVETGATPSTPGLVPVTRLLD